MRLIAFLAATLKNAYPRTALSHFAVSIGFCPFGIHKVSVLKHRLFFDLQCVRIELAIELFFQISYETCPSSIVLLSEIGGVINDILIIAGILRLIGVYCVELGERIILPSVKDGCNTTTNIYNNIATFPAILLPITHFFVWE